MLVQGDVKPQARGLVALKIKLNAVSLHFVARHPLVWAKPGRCYWNVRDIVAQVGGKIRFGWLVTEIKSLTLLAWHHAVWEHPEGELIDITPHAQTGWDSGTTAFFLDPQQDYDLSWPPAQIQRFEPLISDPRLDAFIGAYQDQFALQRAYLSCQKAVPGVAFDEEHMRLHTNDPTSGAVLQELKQTWMPRINAADARRTTLLDTLVACQNELLQPAA